MKTLFILFMALLSVSVSWAGGTGSTSTGGNRPTADRLSQFKSMDAVKFQHFNKGKVEFYFKERNVPAAKLYEVKVEDINNKYIEALQKSAESKSWQIVLPDSE